ncbi:MAG TPA: 30S ribosomal protein S13 [Nitrospirae bacterium]|nr:30S ribosomal protein S13 [bacterium BMS3Abin09]GBE41508.1 30S ribosomal protein S13 [bacterium BMS3Bbin09]HDH34734.1 30S ribosomal protein S13 [Nitrospirota bacterium]HDN95147.1 30S ribosomal protein S13 [Nitrospirota bacterium]HDO66656.1 30S ribosomal protein S13 [Nitrospirota bacterium]
MRIAGVDLPRKERLEIALTRIFGIGRTASKKIIEETGLDLNKKADDLTDEEGVKLRAAIDKDYTVEGDLRREISMNIKRLQDIGCYRGLRHRSRLPVRGQRTSTNARTRKGPKKSVGGMKKKGI